MTTLHLGDCANGCATCSEKYHSNFAGQTCDTCDNYCEEARFSCGICGEIFENKEVMETKWGNGFTEFTCLPCFEREIK